MPAAYNNHALRWAAMNGHTAVVQLLLDLPVERNVDPAAANNFAIRMAAQFGRSAFAGAVNFVTRAPTNEFEGEINARMGEDADYNLGGFLSGPIIQDKLLFFVARRDGTGEHHFSETYAEHQRAVGDRLVARHADAALERSGPGRGKR